MKTINTRQLWRPQRQEVHQQCSSCPFRVGNDLEFGLLVARLRQKEGIRGKMTQAIVRFARLALLVDLDKTGDFICHQTAYDGQMNLRPSKEHRQCAGATQIYRTGELPK